MWSPFTSKYINVINNHDTNLINNTKFIERIKEIRYNINMLPTVTYQIDKVTIKHNVLNQLKDSPWVSKRLSFDGLTYDIHIHWLNNLINTNTNNTFDNNIYIKTTKYKYKKIKKRLPIFLKIMNYLQINGRNKKNITLYFVLSNLQKYVDPNKIIGPEHINSGYTNTQNHIIFIWREEDFEKVTCLELKK